MVAECPTALQQSTPSSTYPEVILSCLEPVQAKQPILSEITVHLDLEVTITPESIVEAEISRIPAADYMKVPYPEPVYVQQSSLSEFS